MRHYSSESPLDAPNIHLLLPYVADLELEVDRLRKQCRFIKHEVRETLRHVRGLCANASPTGNAPPRPPLPEIDQAVHQLAVVMQDLQDPPGYHPAHDQVVAIAVRPLVEQVFRCQQRLFGVPEVILRLELESEHVEWFPARLRHILDNLLSNAVRSCDPDKDQAWVQLQLRVSPDGYEFRVSDNGIGLTAGQDDQMFGLFYRAAPARAAGLGVGLPVVKMLVEQSAGTLEIESGEGQGTTFTVVLPRYEVHDYLN
jgi:signal transduction histidine kinase